MSDNVGKRFETDMYTYISELIPVLKSC